MALKKWDDDSGAAFGAPTTQDLSHLCADDVFAGQSMAGGNATTSTPPFGAPGSESEGTALVMDTALHDFGDATQVHTALSAPQTPDEQTSTKVSG